jgi:hypothetical protein
VGHHRAGKNCQDHAGAPGQGANLLLAECFLHSWFANHESRTRSAGGNSHYLFDQCFLSSAIMRIFPKIDHAPSHWPARWFQVQESNAMAANALRASFQFDRAVCRSRYKPYDEPEKFSEVSQISRIVP